MKHIYVLRVNDANNQSKNGFQYPRKGKVSAPDWNPSPECGGGLHGWESGEGDPSVATIHPDGVWLVLKVEDSPENLVRLNGKVKFREGTVVFAGSRNAATEYIYNKTKAPRVLWVNLTGGDYSTLAGGNDSTLTWKVWDCQRYRLHTFYTGEAGIEADKPYRFTDGKIEEVTP